MPLQPYEPAEDPNKTYFFDDFFGAAYNNVQWTGTASGTNSAISIPAPCIGGQVRLRAGNANARYYELRQDGDAFSIGTLFDITWRARLGQTTSCRGTFGVSTDTSNIIEWTYDSSLSANWQQSAVIGGSRVITDALRQDTGLAQAADTSFHEFRIVADSTLAHFLLDNMPMGSIANTGGTILPAGNLGPHSRSTSYTTGTKDVYLDSITIWGRRILPID